MTEKIPQNTDNTPLSLEMASRCTTGEIQWWINQAMLGQDLFNTLYEHELITPIVFAPSYNDIDTITTYDYGLRQIIVTFKELNNSVRSRRSYVQKPNLRVTTPHLYRLGVCTTPELKPIFTGIEEQAHAYFHTVIEPTLPQHKIQSTNRYDGSDSSEEFAFQSIIKVIFQRNELDIFPIPKNLNVEIM